MLYLCFSNVRLRTKQHPLTIIIFPSVEISLIFLLFVVFSSSVCEFLPTFTILTEIGGRLTARQFFEVKNTFYFVHKNLRKAH